MKTIARAAALFASAAMPLLISTSARAEPDYSLSANVTLASQYLFRGIAQTAGKPSIQGGFDFSHKSGFYLGNWNSNISWLSDSTPGLTAPIEMDFYGGYKTNLGQFTLDLGGLYYYYPTGGTKPPGFISPNTFELYAGLGWGPLSVKYSHATTKLFGLPDSKNSYYIDGTFNYAFADTAFAVLAHVGYQGVKTGSQTGTCGNTGQKDYSYTDWKLGGTYTIEGWTIGAFYSDTNAESACYTNPAGRNNAKSSFLATIGRSF